MRKYYSQVVFILLLLAGSPAYANHIFGGELLYKHISGNTYKVTLTIYGDCGSSSPSAFAGLSNAAPLISIIDGNTQITYPSLTLQIEGAGQEVSPVCDAERNNTTCNGGIYPGVKRFIYSGTTTLPGTSPNWRFIFDGDFQNNTSAGRSSNITNVQGIGGQLMYIEAMLNNVQGPNSSPTYSTIPTPFYCINQAQSYNQGAIDPDGDVLSFALAPALINSLSSVNYISPYTATQPLATSGGVTLNMLNGQMTFTPSLVQNALVVNEVSEYRNGVLVGRSRREMTFVVLGNCSNAPLNNTGVVQLSGANLIDSNVIATCDHFSFDLTPTTLAGGTIQVSWVTDIVAPGFNIAVTGDNTANPVVKVNLASIPTFMIGNTYNIFVTFSINACPLASKRTIAYTVRVVSPPLVTATVLTPTNCVGPARVAFAFAGYNGTNPFLAPVSATLLRNGAVIRQWSNITANMEDMLSPGHYRFAAGYASLSCGSDTLDFDVADSGRYPYRPVISGQQHYCTGDPAVALMATPNQGGVIQWYDQVMNPLAGTPVINTTTPGVTTWYVDQTYLTCRSDYDTVTVYVTDRPTAGFTLPPAICQNELADVVFNGATGAGAVVYNWNWDGGAATQLDPVPSYHVAWNSEGIKTISLQVSENQCPSAVITKTINIKGLPVVDFEATDACLNQPMRIHYTPDPVTATYTWGFDGGTAVQQDAGTYNVTWAFPGIKHVTLTGQNDGCLDSFAQDMNVFPFPDVVILNQPGTVCLGDKIYLQAVGGTKQTWGPWDKISREPDGTIYTRVMEPATYYVYASNDYGCNDSASITYTTVEPCCQFSYPNAFTPNGDGKNDLFSIPTYGNAEWYSLSIFNRWGQRVYWSDNAASKWDGSFEGAPCDAGVYFYYFKAKCMTGHLEEKKGDIMLIR